MGSTEQPRDDHGRWTTGGSGSAGSRAISRVPKYGIKSSFESGRINGVPYTRFAVKQDAKSQKAVIKSWTRSASRQVGQ